MSSFEGPGSRPRDEPPRDGSNRIGTEYDRPQAARRDLDVLVEELTQISREVSWLARQVREALSTRPDLDMEGTSDSLEEALMWRREAFPRWADTLLAAVSQLIATLHALVDAGPGQPADLAFSATAQLSALRSAVDGAPPLWPCAFPPPTVFLAANQLERNTVAPTTNALTRAWPRLWSRDDPALNHWDGCQTVAVISHGAHALVMAPILITRCR